MSFKYLHALPLPIPVPELYGHIITRSQDKGVSRMYGDGANVVRVGFEGCDFLACIVVIDTELEVVAAADNPVLTADEATCSHGDIGEFEGFNDGLRFVGPNVDMAGIEGGEDL